MTFSFQIKTKSFFYKTLKSLLFHIFYILPKIIKNPIVGRPILAGCNWITRPASKYIAFHLQKKYYNLFDTIITDRLDVLRFIETVELPAGCELSTIDVVSLYTNIPLDHFTEVIKKLFKDHPIPEAELLLDLLHFVIYNNILQFDGTTYTLSYTIKEICHYKWERKGFLKHANDFL